MKLNNTSTALSDAQEELDTIQVPTSGELPVPMTNDYLFRALLQENNKVLCELIRDLLHLDENTTVEAEIQNPIILGESVTDKTFILDILIRLNNSALVNLEMQVINEKNWVERSLAYLCRNFDGLKTGENYLQSSPVYQIGFLNFTLFEDAPEFDASYKLLNEKNHREYSDKLQIKVLDLTQIELATEEDKLYKIDYWAKLFKATSWEEINMLTENKPIINDAAKTVVKLTAEERIRMQCEAREDFLKTQNDVHYYYNTKLAEKDAALQEKDVALQEKNVELQEKNVELQEKDALIAELQRQLSEKK